MLKMVLGNRRRHSARHINKARCHLLLVLSVCFFHMVINSIHFLNTPTIGLLGRPFFKRKEKADDNRVGSHFVSHCRKVFGVKE